MATELQRRANRANALKSTGPKTEAGKTVVRLNALRHGLLAAAPVMVGEDSGEYAALCDRLNDELSPVGVLEEQIVLRMAGALWRLRRLSHIEAGLLTGNVAAEYAQAADQQAAGYTHVESNDFFENLSFQTIVVDDEEAHRIAQQAAEDARAVLLADAALLGASYRSDAAGADALTKLCRYEATLERSLYRASEELQRLQEARRVREEAERERAGKACVGAMLRRALDRDGQSYEQDEAH